jgi:hypothetical protein
MIIIILLFVSPSTATPRFLTHLFIHENSIRAITKTAGAGAAGAAAGATGATGDEGTAAERSSHRASARRNKINPSAPKFISPFGPMRANKHTVRANDHGWIVKVVELLVGIADWHAKGKKVLR